MLLLLLSLLLSLLLLLLLLLSDSLGEALPNGDQITCAAALSQTVAKTLGKRVCQSYISKDI